MAIPIPGITDRGLSMQAICREFLNRRAGILKALTTDVDEFYKQCDPEKDELCLYGLPDRTWQVRPPPANVPPELPEPTVGINFVRNMEKKRWLKNVAMHSDVWLLRIALYRASFAGFDEESRNKLFDTINGPPTLLEVVMTGKEEEKDEKEEVREARCAACGSGADGVWILCFGCQRGFHRWCIRQGKCPVCIN